VIRCAAFTSVIVLALTLCVMVSTALALEGYISAGTFGTPCTTPPCQGGELNQPLGIAANASLSSAVSGDVYVVDSGDNRVERFSASGAYEGQFDGSGEFEVSGKKELGAAAPTGRLQAPEWIAIDNSGKPSLEDPSVNDVYVTDPGHTVVDKFTATGEYVGQLSAACEAPGEAPPCLGSGVIPFGELLGVAVDANGDLWVHSLREGESVFYEFDQAGVFLTSFTSGRPPQSGGLALDSANTLYTTGGGERFILKFAAATGEELEQISVSVTGATSVAVSPANEDVLVDQGTQLALFGPFGEERSEGLEGPIQTVGGLTESRGVTVAASGKAYATEQNADVVHVFDFAPLTPSITGEAAAEVGATEAVIGAQIDPFGELASYRIEYGLTESYGSGTPQHEIGSPLEVVNVQATLRSLQPDSEYHFRVLATNPVGTTVGPDRTFTTTATPPGGAGLPDGRAYESVSGADASGQAYVPYGGITAPAREVTVSRSAIRAASDGNVLAYVGDPEGAEEGNGLTGPGTGNEFIARREAGLGRWLPGGITPQIAAPGEEAAITAYEAFSSDLSTGFFSAVSTPAFAGRATPNGPNRACTAVYSRTADGVFHGLFAQTPPTGTCGPTFATEQNYTAQNLMFAGANAGGAAAPANSLVAFQTPAALTGGSAASPEGQEGDNLYLSSEGLAHPIAILPEGGEDANATFGSTSGDLVSLPGDFSNVLSADGSRVFWTALEPSGSSAPELLKALYVREDPLSASARTVQLDSSQAPSGEGATEKSEREARSGGGRFWTAAANGEEVFFTDCAQLTEPSSAVSSPGCAHTEGAAEIPSGNDLYEYDFARPLGQRLRDLTVDVNTSDPLGADVQGVVGASEDGGAVSFVANGVLTGAPNGEGTSPSPGQPNLYVRQGGNTDFVATLARGDNELNLSQRNPRGPELLGDWRPNVGSRTAAVTADGHSVVFESTRRLGSFDNNGTREVYVYTAAGDGSAKLSCVSCVLGATSPTEVGSYLTASLSSTFTPRWMSEDGDRVFYDSDQALSPEDKNGTLDVYEWEREGAGSCQHAQSSADGGCVYLISGGRSGTPSYFLDADRSGDNVFFTHRGQLGGEGSAEQNGVFDARVAGGFPRISTGCTGASCQTAPQSAATPEGPATATNPAGGNVAGEVVGKPPAKKQKTAAEVRAQRLRQALRACRAKHQRRKRVACEKQARKRYGPLSHRKTRHKTARSGGRRRIVR
jgi:hypothetical protein